MDSFVSQHISFPLIAASFIATACQGSLNALVFLLDPTVRTGWYHVRLELIKRYYLDLQENKDDDAFGTYERPTQANRNYIPQNNKDKIASLFNALFFLCDGWYEHFYVIGSIIFYWCIAMDESILQNMTPVH
ncbi:hypothetical protein BDF19DRAFT_151404 [Syncephalis fuscata]|nr:hypothetical protein BDF19DRAFT_151404 [Syncephalis fuscata]